MQKALRSYNEIHLMKQRLVIFFVLMGSYFGFYLVFPLFPTIFLTESQQFVSPNTSVATKTILLGFTYTIYYIGTFIGTPLIGRLSDRTSRKKVLSITLLLAALTYILSAIAIHLSSLILLLFARFWTGFFEANYSLAYTILVDMDKDSDEKLNNLEFWSTSISNIGWITGSLIGWNLVGESFLAIPFWGGCLMFLTSFCLVSLFFPDTKPEEPSIVNNSNPFFSVITSFKQATLRPILMSNTAFFAATSIFACYTPLFLLKQYHFEPASLGTVDSYLSISSCLAPFTYWIYSKYFSRKEAVCISSFGIAFSLLMLITLPFNGAICCSLFLMSYFTAVGFSFSTFLVTDYTPPHGRGEALGVNQALYVLIEAVSSFICGMLAAISFYLPLTIAIICALFSACCIFYYLLLPTAARSLNPSLQK